MDEERKEREGLQVGVRGGGMVRVMGLRKACNNANSLAKVAVHEAWFGLPSGQCIGVLCVIGPVG